MEVAMEAGKTLYLVRHAKSSWNHAELTDFDRPLNKRGYRDAPEMGHRLKARGALPEVIICSPARRARETLENMQLGVENVVFDEMVYGAGAGDLLIAVRSIKNSCSRAMLIGHNPSITLLAGRLSGHPVDNMPTCAIAVIGLDSDLWSKAGSCPAELLDFDYPKKPSK
jgi:phosphohistidine phosphatase